MSQDIERARRRLERLRDAAPHAAELALVASPASRIEPRLIRILRRQLLPWTDVGSEGDLWFSSLVESRGRESIVFNMHVAHLLRIQLYKRGDLWVSACNAIEEFHQYLPETLRLEEKLTRLALEDNREAIEVALRPAIRTLSRGGDDARAVAHWVLRALPRAESAIQWTTAARTLVLQSLPYIGKRRLLPDSLISTARLDDIAWALPDQSNSPRINIGVERYDRGIRFVFMQPTRHQFSVPKTDPILVEISWANRDFHQYDILEINHGLFYSVPQSIDPIIIRTLADEYFEVSITTSNTLPIERSGVFISYARNDDLKPVLENAPQGWVTFFWQQLRVALTDSGLPEARLWLDRFEIDPTEEFTPKIEAAIRGAEILIVILSDNWLRRDWCQRDLATFCAEHPRARDNIVLVVKNEPRSQLPVPLQGREGYRFFEREPSGGLREFYWMGLQDQKAYFSILKKIATWIADRLLDAPPPSATEITPWRRRTVYVAVAAGELGDARQRLVTDLTGAGYTVVPARDRLPDTLVAAEKEVTDALAGAELAVLILGEQGGVIPGGGQEAIVPLQLRLARSRGLPRVLWAPKWLPASPNVKRDPFAVVARFGERQDKEDVYGEEVTDLSQWLRSRLDRRDEQQPQVAAPVILIAAAASEDNELALTLAGRLPDDDVRPLWAGDPVPADLQRPQVVIPWRSASGAALESLLAAVKETAASITVLRLPGGDEAAKSRFFSKGVGIETLPALPDGRRATRDLMVRLELLGARP